MHSIAFPIHSWVDITHFGRLKTPFSFNVCHVCCQITPLWVWFQITLVDLFIRSKTLKSIKIHSLLFIYLFISIYQQEEEEKKTSKVHPFLVGWPWWPSPRPSTSPRPPGPGARSLGRNPSPSHPRGCCHLCTHGFLKAWNILKPHCPWQSTLWLCQNNSYWKWWLSIVMLVYQRVNYNISRTWIVRPFWDDSP